MGSLNGGGFELATRYTKRHKTKLFLLRACFWVASFDLPLPISEYESVGSSYFDRMGKFHHGDLLEFMDCSPLSIVKITRLTLLLAAANVGPSLLGQQKPPTTSPPTNQNGRHELGTFATPTSQAFAPFENVKTQVDEQELVIESDGLPEHNMMIGIRAWQQQVPLPQPFFGENAWRLPLQPEFSNQPISVRKEPLRGAIALAVNGVPIFCALNNRGEDSYLLGELDEWGGHCGRGDDYHYHIAPVHLEKKAGKGRPIAFALDGFPILGYTEADGSTPKDLDEFNGHQDTNGNYHYHATKMFPYINGGLRGKVELRGNQIEQPRDSPIRPGQNPLNGATITDFTREGMKFHLDYELKGKKGSIHYEVLSDEQVGFEFNPPNGTSAKVIYKRGRSGSYLWLVVSSSLVLAGLFVVAFLFKRKIDK